MSNFKPVDLSQGKVLVGKDKQREIEVAQLAGGILMTLLQGTGDSVNPSVAVNLSFEIAEKFLDRVPH